MNCIFWTEGIVPLELDACILKVFLDVGFLITSVAGDRVRHNLDELTFIGNVSDIDGDSAGALEKVYGWMQLIVSWRYILYFVLAAETAHATLLFEASDLVGQPTDLALQGHLIVIVDL